MDNLKPIPINKLYNKKFFIAKYQRGYRWVNLQVEQLLDDIDSFIPREILGKPDEKTFYCLQPVDVKLMDDDAKNKHNLKEDWYEVIDGQQRLTTIYIILQYINQKWRGEDKLPQFTLNYETRPGCVQFLDELKVNTDDTVDISKENIDYYHISKALQTIRQWQLNYQQKKGKPFNDSNFQSTFEESAQIIWYEVSQKEESNVLFERLNLGKIPLTNAELTKALFLSSESFKELVGEEKQMKQFEIARLWDEIEHKLNEPNLKFWSFITNKKRDNYETKIELILDLISGKKDDEKDEYFTFLEFSRKQKEEGLTKVWDEIEHFYNTICEWYIDKDFYHKIGYLITSRNFSIYKGIDLNKLVKDSMTNTKEDFKQQIDELIKSSVKFEISELRYDTHTNQIFNVLLLFNIATILRSDAITNFYPFKQHKDKQWSLEHIHARKSENFHETKKDTWRKWLEIHCALLKEIAETKTDTKEKRSYIKLKEKASNYNNEQLTWARFTELFKEINDLLTPDIDSMDKESEGLSNLALLSQPDNAALNNSVFEVKRQEIIRMDKQGHFIPICTRWVFLKYYNEKKGLDTQYIYWDKDDREQYYKILKETLDSFKFLPINYIEENIDDNENE